MLADAAAREAALDPSRSFIVQAPAGSGKTELLVRRFLRLLKAVNQPEEVLAITFTRKAAAEMRQRVLKEVSPDLAHRLKIQTIDALCVSLTRQMPVQSRFGAQLDLVDKADAHYLEAAQRTVAMIDANDSVARLLAHLDGNADTAIRLISSMLAKRDQWLRKTGSPPTRKQLEENLRLEREMLLSRARALDPRACEEFAREALTKEGTWRKKGVLSDSTDEPLRLALCALLVMPPARYTDPQWEILEAILKLLPLAAAQLKVVFAERGQTDFTEAAQGAVRALGTMESPTDLLLALDYRIKHILVDEFQDTSISQFELLSLLTAGWTANDGRTLFLVGDPMQSIYRFREAEVSLFLRATKSGLPSVKLEPLTLSTNFRSQENLVGFFNDSFAQIFPSAADEASGAVPYSPAASKNPPLPGPAATWHPFATEAEEAKRVVELVREAQGSAAILVRNRNVLGEIVKALKQSGIRWRAIEIEKLGEKQVVQDLYALTRALLHLGDRIAWLSILRAPWCGLSLEALHSIANRERNSTIWETIKGDLFLDHFTRILAPAIANRERGTLRDRVESVWLALGGPACAESETDLEDAEIFLDQLEKLEQAGGIDDLAALEQSLDTLYALPDLSAGDDSLQIMTIHKAKGLEFGTVIVPGLDKGPGRSDTPLFLWKERVWPPVKGAVSEPHGSRAGGLLLAPIAETGSDEDPAYQYLKRLDSDAEDVEAVRLLYVAATRAENRLHLTGCVKCDDDGSTRKPYRHTLLEKAWPVAEPHMQLQGSDDVNMKGGKLPIPLPSGEGLGEGSVVAQTLLRLAPDFTHPSPPPAAAWTPPPEPREEEQIEFSWVGETARHVGSVVHRWLQVIAEDQLEGWDANRVASLRKSFQRELERRGVPASEAKSAADRIASALANTLADERGRWVLGAQAESRTEHRVRARTTEGVRTLIIDRLFRDRQGVRWIVDYKTSRHEGADVDAFLDEERRRYAAQLDAYAAALGGASRGLYFPLLAGWRSW